MTLPINWLRTLAILIMALDEPQALALDIELAQVIFKDCYGPGHTLSYCLGVMEAQGNPQAKQVCDLLAQVLGPNHCANAVANEGGMPA